MTNSYTRNPRSHHATVRRKIIRRIERRGCASRISHDCSPRMTHASPHASANLRSLANARDAISPVSERSTRRTAYPHDRADAAKTLVPTLICFARIETRQLHVCEHHARSAAEIMHRGANPRGMRRRGGHSASLGPSHEHRPSDETRGRAVRARAGIHAPPNGGVARAHTVVRSSKLVEPLPGLMF